MNKKTEYKTLGSLLAVSLLSGAILSAPFASADSSDTVNIKVKVPAACTLTATNNNLVKTINPGTGDTIGIANLKAVCNDPDGFALYAVGYTDGIYGKNVLATALTNGENNYDIITGTATSGATSNWNMTIGNNDITGNYSATIENDFDQAHAVPTTYTKIATITSETDQTIGTNLNAQFDAYIAPAQPASSYQGKVKFTLIHPNTNAVAPDTLYSMQNVNNWGSGVELGETVTAVDERDGETYTVARLADGNLWMTKNLRLNLAAANITAENTNNPTSDFLSDVADSTKNAANNAAWCTDRTAECINLTQYSTINLGDTTGGEDGYTYDDYGVYYNWYTATAGHGTFETTTYTNTAGDICPSGWRLPTGVGENYVYDNEFVNLVYSVVGRYSANYGSGIPSYSGEDGVEADTLLRAHPVNYTHSGRFSGGSVVERGTFGRYWSAGAVDANRGFGLSIYETPEYGSAAIPMTNFTKNLGLAIRCIANEQTTQGTMLDAGTVVNAKMKTVAEGVDTPYTTSSTKIKAIRMADALPADFEATETNTISAANSDYPVYIFFDDTNDAGILYVYTEGEQISMHPSSNYMFAVQKGLTDISGIANWDTSKVRTMVRMFTGDSALTEADLSHWDTSNVGTMAGLFNGNTALRSVNTTGWDTSKVTNMGTMFQVGASWAGDGQLQEIIGIGDWDTSNVTNMGWMFYGAGQMTHYDIANWNVSKVQTFNHTFCDNFKLESLDLSRWDVSSVKTMYDMFDDNYKLTTIGDVSHWNTKNLIDLGGWLNGSSSFVGNNGTLDLSGWDTSNLKSAEEVFRATKLTTIDLTGWTFDAITNSSWDGAGSGIYGEYGTALDRMFQNASLLNTVYVSRSGLNSYNDAVNRGVDITNMWSGAGVSGFTVKP